MTYKDWKTCPHVWGPHETVREELYGVAFGSKRVCLDCGAVEYESWCETRASGGIPKVTAPPCGHEHLNMEGVCRKCGEDCRGAE